jgi:hypothetical protein
MDSSKLKVGWKEKAQKRSMGAWTEKAKPTKMDGSKQTAQTRSKEKLTQTAAVIPRVEWKLTGQLV